MSRTNDDMTKARLNFEKSGWHRVNDYNGGISHPEHGRLNFNFRNFTYCCGAAEMGSLRFTLTNEKSCLVAMKNYLKANRQSLLLATVNSKQKKEKDFLLKVGFELLDNLKFKNKNTKNTVEVLCLRDRMYKKDEVQQCLTIRKVSKMKFNREKSDAAKEWLAKNSWLVNEAGAAHLTYGRFGYHIRGFQYCCGASEIGNFSVGIPANLETYKEVFKKVCEMYQKGLFLATLNKDQTLQREIITHAGFVPIQEKFYNQNTANNIEVFVLTIDAK